MLDVVGEMMKRTLSGVGTAAGGMIAPGVAAALATLGIPPEGAAALAAAVGATVEQLGDFAGSLWGDQLRRTGRFAASAQEAAGFPFDEILERVSRDENLRDLLRASYDAARQSVDEQKIDALAFLLGTSVADDSKIDMSRLLVEVLRVIQPLHLRLLRILVRENPYYPADYEPERKRLWPTRRILEEDPELAPALGVITAQLVAIGVMYPVAGRADDQGQWELTDLGRACLAALRLRGSAWSEG